jgi:predicted GNAT family acetyltransferase
MSEVHVTFDAHGGGRFYIEHDGEPIAYLAFHIRGGILTAIHTDVLKAWSGHGLGGKLADAMAGYARTHKLKILPLCPYVLSLFKKNPERYDDVWERAK